MVEENQFLVSGKVIKIMLKNTGVLCLPFFKTENWFVQN